MSLSSNIVSSANFAVDCAWNGQEAIDIFAASEPGTYKAILMDVHMPILDGYQATRLIRQAKRPDAKSVPIIAMTADIFVKDIEQVNNAGMNAHIAKPIHLESLYKVLSANMNL